MAQPSPAVDPRDALLADGETVMLSWREHLQLKRIANSFEQLGVLVETSDGGMVNAENLGQLLGLLSDGLKKLAADAVPVGRPATAGDPKDGN